MLLIAAAQIIEDQLLLTPDSTLESAKNILKTIEVGSKWVSQASSIKLENNNNVKIEQEVNLNLAKRDKRKGSSTPISNSKSDQIGPCMGSSNNDLQIEVGVGVYQNFLIFCGWSLKLGLEWCMGRNDQIFSSYQLIIVPKLKFRTSSFYFTDKL